MARTPMTLVAGGLGSGKTTLLRRLLSGEHGRIAVLVNEFGELGIDGTLLRGDNVEMMELTGGCVCCSLAGEFEAAVREIAERVQPEAILVESTGVAEADALVDDVEESLPEVRLDAVIVLVDADVAQRFPELGYAERSQLETADIILLNKIDLVDETAVEEIRRRLHQLNPAARILDTVHAAVDPRIILPDTHPSPRHHAPVARGDRGLHDHEPGHGMESFLWRPGDGLRRDCFEAAVETWPKAVFRAKGRVVLDGEMLLFNYVAGRWTLEPTAGEGEPAVVWIGPEVTRYRASILRALEHCHA